MTAIPNKKVLALCMAVQICDDRLGKYSDHEGNEDGPAYHFWQRGHLLFDMQCDRAIADHAAAIKVWRRFKRLNSRRVNL